MVLRMDHHHHPGPYHANPMECLIHTQRKWRFHIQLLFGPVMTVMLGAITVVGDVVDGVKLYVTTVVEMERFGTLIMREINTEVVVLVVEVMDIVVVLLVVEMVVLHVTHVMVIGK